MDLKKIKHYNIRTKTVPKSLHRLPRTLKVDFRVRLTALFDSSGVVAAGLLERHEVKSLAVR